MGCKSMWLVGCCVAVAACGSSDNEDRAFAEQAIDSADVSSIETALLIVATDNIDETASAEEIAEAALTSIPNDFLQPDGCVATSRNGVVVTLGINKCSGPYGLAEITGTFTMTYAVDNLGVHATIVATGVGVNGADLDIDVTGLYSIVGQAQKLTVGSSTVGQGRFGHDLTRNGAYTVRWDAIGECSTLSGSWQTIVGALTWVTEVSNYERCKKRCPSDLSLIEYTGGLTGVEVRVEFNGSSTAIWSTSRDKSGTLSLECNL